MGPYCEPTPMNTDLTPAPTPEELELSQDIVASVHQLGDDKLAINAVSSVLASLRHSTLALYSATTIHSCSDSCQRPYCVLRREKEALSGALREEQLKTQALTANIKKWADCAEYGWTIIANASGGNWELESKDWQKAAVKFRDENYYPCLSLLPRSMPIAAQHPDCMKCGKPIYQGVLCAQCHSGPILSALAGEQPTRP